MNQAENIFEQASTWLERLYSAPAIALVLAFCIVLGYVLRFFKCIPKEGIPMAVIFSGPAFFMFIASDNNDLTMRIWLGRNLMFGIVLGFLAWVIHRTLLKPLEDKWLNGKDDVPPPPPSEQSKP